METNHAITALSALAHEGRLALFRRLVQAGPDGLAAGELSRAEGVNFTTASAQLSVLAGASLVSSERAGRSVIYRAEYAAMASLIAYLLEDCCQGRREVATQVADLAASWSCASR